MSRNVLVLGAGPGGMTAATQLRQLLPAGDRVTLIDRSRWQRSGVAHLLVMRGLTEPEAVSIDLSRLDRQGIEFVQAEIHRVDTEQRRVETSSGVRDYDAIVIALGVELRPDRIPGLGPAIESGHAGEYYSFDGAVRLRDRLAGFSGGRVAVVISSLPYKCPPAPYEAALLIDDLLRSRGLREKSEISLYTPEPSPIVPGGPTVGDAIRDILNDHDVTLHTSATLVSVDQATATFSNDARVTSDLLVVIPPHAVPAVLVDSGLVEKGWLPADRHTLRTGFDRVWAVGDVTSVPMANGAPLPKAGIFATAEGEAAARDIARTLGGPAPEPHFTGVGRCWFAISEGLAGSVGGDFFAPAGPRLDLQSPTAGSFQALHAEVQASAQGADGGRG